ncbi:MAG: MBL fold metallo-hydrolase [Brachymonas sp.]|jgi:recombination protein RecT
MIRPTQALHSAQAPTDFLPSATVLLLRPAALGGGDGVDGVEVLISQRSAHTAFVPSMYVFPGGRVDAEDAHWAAHWMAHWQGLFPAAWPVRTRTQALAAVRECFEEMGVLLALDADGLAPDAAQSASLQRQQPLFAQLAAKGWQPAISALAWVCDRVPPASLPRRYHTAFFYAAMPAAQSVQPDLHEQLDAVWLPVRSSEWQTSQGQQRYPMIAPTVEALQGLQQFASPAAALAAARAQNPVPHHFAREVWQGGALQRINATHLAYAEVELIDVSGQVQPSIDWQYQQPVLLTQSVQRITCPNPSMMSGPGTNTYLIGSAEQGFVVLDAGPADKGHIRRILQATGGRIHSLFCTHSHPDHAPGALLLHRFLRLKQTPVPLYGMASLPTAAAHSRFTPTHQVEDGQLLVLPAIADKQALTLQCIHTPGHAANHVCLLLQEDGILFSGDHILSGTTTVIAPPDGDMDDYLLALDKLDAACTQWDAQYILPAHGHVLGGFGATEPTQPPASGAGARRIIAYYRQHRWAREAKIMAAMRSAGISSNTPASRQQLLPLAYADAPPALWPVAERSLEAHIARILALGLLAKA